jgi:hypothetical protein
MALTVWYLNTIQGKYEIYFSRKLYTQVSENGLNVALLRAARFLLQAR